MREVCPPQLNVDLMLGHRLQWWPNHKPTAIA